MASLRSMPHVVTRVIQTLLLSSVLLASARPAISQARFTTAIKPDGTLGTTVTQAGNVYNIAGGTIRGSNLFQSLDRLSVGTGDVASFNGPSGIANILSRVTGGQTSMIDGTLRSTIPGANLFLLNPSGVLFGPNASLDVSGSFHVSTADYLRFTDGAKFFAGLGRESVLTVVAPAAFGFLSPNPAAVTIQGGTLRVSPGKTLSVVGGDIAMEGPGALQDLEHPIPTLQAPRGRIQLASVGAPGEVPLDLADLSEAAFTRLGRLTLSQGAFVDASGDGGGVVLMRAHSLRVDHALIHADNMGDINGIGLGIDVRVTADAVFQNDAGITSASYKGGRARDFRLSAGSLDVLDNAYLGTTSFGSGDAGNMRLEVGRLTVTNGSNVDTSATGGLMDWLPAPFDCKCPSPNNDLGQGKAGDMTVIATDTVLITGLNESTGFLSALVSATLSRRSGGGRLFLAAPVLRVENLGVINGGITYGGADGATTELRVGQLTLTNGGQIFNGTGGIQYSAGLGRGGDLIVTAEAITISGTKIDIGATGLFTGTQGPGQGGDIHITAGNIHINGGGDTQSGITSSPSSACPNCGDGGNVFISASAIQLENSGVIGTSVGRSGNAGTVEVRAEQISLTSGGNISSRSGVIKQNTLRVGPGRGGNVTVIANDLLTIDGQDPAALPSGIFAKTFGTGPGGDVRITARRLRLENGGTISADSSGDGAAGSLLLQVGETFQARHGLVTTTSTRAGGGAITVRVGSLLDLLESDLTTSVQGGGGDAGNITINAPSVIVDHSRITANAFGGKGGNISINAEVVLADPTSLVSASSTLGIQGIVDIRAPVINLSGAVAPLPQSFVNVAALLPARCAVRLSGGQVSSLVVGGRDGLPTEPGGLLSSPLVLEGQGDVETVQRRAAQPYVPASRLTLLERPALVWGCGL